MKTAVNTLIITILLATGVFALGARQTTTADALVADLYTEHDANRSPFFQTRSRARVDKYFAKPLADLIWKDSKETVSEIAKLDSDPLYYAQDTEIRNFSVGKAVVKGTTATVMVRFTNFGDKMTIKFVLKQVAGKWKINDIHYDDEGDTLLKWLKGAFDFAEGTASTEFEGAFRVGSTTCLVRPARMSFEVKWANGSGVETFVYAEDNTFESVNKMGPNRFEFDDDSYTTGTFYRNDGSTFPVKRLR